MWSQHTRQLLTAGKANSCLSRELRTAVVGIYIDMALLVCLFHRSVRQDERGDWREGTSGCSDSEEGRDGQQLQKEVDKQCLKLAHQGISVRNSVSNYGRPSRDKAIRVDSCCLWNMG